MHATADRRQMHACRFHALSASTIYCAVRLQQRWSHVAGELSLSALQLQHHTAARKLLMAWAGLQCACLLPS